LLLFNLTFLLQLFLLLLGLFKLLLLSIDLHLVAQVLIILLALLLALVLLSFYVGYQAKGLLLRMIFLRILVRDDARLLIIELRLEFFSIGLLNLPAIILTV
jgi:hypothetical protein